MPTPEELARFHIETAIQLVGRERVLALLVSPVETAQVSSPAAPAGGAGARGRRPGAAPDDARCKWKMTDGTQCKNAHTAEAVYCKIHAGKIDLIEL